MEYQLRSTFFNQYQKCVESGVQKIRVSEQERLGDFFKRMEELDVVQEFFPGGPCVFYHRSKIIEKPDEGSQDYDKLVHHIWEPTEAIKLLPAVLDIPVWLRK